MEEVRKYQVNLAALKAAITPKDFKRELQKVTSVTDLTEHEWSELVEWSKKRIDRCILITTDEDEIFRCLLRKLIELSSEKEKLSLTEQRFSDCNTLLHQRRFKTLYNDFKNPQGYSLRFFLYKRGPTVCVGAPYEETAQDQICEGPKKITKFKEGYIPFNYLCDKVITIAFGGSIDLTVFTFLVSEFGKDFAPQIFSGLLPLTINIDSYDNFLCKALNVIKENRVMLNECYKAYLVHFVGSNEFKNFSKDVLINSCPTSPSILRYIRIFSLLLDYGVDASLIMANGKNLNNVVVELKKHLQQDWLPNDMWFKELCTAVQGLSKKINIDLVTTMGIFSRRLRAPRDVSVLISHALQAQRRCILTAHKSR